MRMLGIQQRLFWPTLRVLEVMYHVPGPRELLIQSEIGRVEARKSKGPMRALRYMPENEVYWVQGIEQIALNQ